LSDSTGPSSDPIARVVEAVVAFGLAEREPVEAHTESWRRRPPGLATVDEDEEVEMFVHSLVQAGLIESTHAPPLLALVQGPSTRIPDDGLLGRAFGDYVTTRKIGEGGMGKVYLAHRHRTPGDDDTRPSADRCVVKVLNTGGAFADRQRFERERDVLKSLVSPHIVGLLGGSREGELDYVLLEYVEGPTLQQVVDERGALPWEVATRYLRQLALALASAHVMGIVHRDVKPENVLVERGGNLKLCDFGIAKLVGHTIRTEAGEILGSPAYIAPEQWGDHSVDHRADLFALGVIYYLLLTGRLPFNARTPAEYAAKIQAGEYTPLDSVRRGVPPHVQQVVVQLLERNRRYRTPTAHALLVDLDHLSRGEPPDVPRLEPETELLGESLPLIGAKTFRVGSGPQATLHIDDPRVPPEVAEIERTAAGFRLRPLDAIDINGRRASSEVTLKPGDSLTVGPGRTYVLQEGNLGGGGLGSLGLVKLAGDEQDFEGPRQPPQVVPALLVAALVEAGHPAALLACLEALDEATGEAETRASGKLLTELGVGRHESQRIAVRAQFLWRKRAVWIANQLFLSTHENFGVRLQDWLRWWSEVGDRYPFQVRAPGERPTVRVQVRPPKGGGTAWSKSLTDGETWIVGRSRSSDLTLRDQAVSRRHLQLERLITRVAFRDLGSRQGTRVWGKRSELGLLQPGDEVEVGWTRLRFAFSCAQPGGARPTVDLNTFRALAELRSTQVVHALIDLLNVPALERACLSAIEEHPRLSEPQAALTPFLHDQAEMAARALGEIAGEALGAEVAPWKAWLERQGDLPTQVAPHGWWA